MSQVASVIAEWLTRNGDSGVVSRGRGSQRIPSDITTPHVLPLGSVAKRVGA